MTLFVGFEEILMCVIKQTACKKGGEAAEEISDEERFDKAMKAIFGERQFDEYIKPPKGLEYSDMLAIQKRINKGMPQEAAFREIAKQKFKKPERETAPKNIEDADDQFYADEVEYEENIERLTATIKMHYHRHFFHYNYRKREVEETSPDPELLRSVLEYDEEQQGKIQKIIKTLKDAGWPI